MAIFTSFLALLGGVGVLITGMNIMSEHLQKVAGRGMKRLIGSITNNRFLGIGTGAAVTAIIQSSAATTVMAIGFVNAGAMTLTQAAPIIMGANIGTTVTGLIASLSSFDISSYFAALTFIGVMMMFVKKGRINNIGGILCGLGLLFIGLELMSLATSNDEIKKLFQTIFSYIDFPILLFLVGVIVTAIMQSSSAMISMTIVMAMSSTITISESLYLIIGANVGTCLTSLIATIGTSTNAKRTGVLHLVIKLIGALIFIPLVWIFNKQVVSLLSHISVVSFQVAVFHVIFNILLTVILLPFIKQLVRLVEIMIPEKESDFKHSLKYIDDLELRTPTIAVMQVKKEIEHMASLAKNNLEKGFTAMCTQESKFDKEIEMRENQIDYLNVEITAFLIKLSPLVDGHNVTEVGSFYHVVNDIERIGDHAENFLNVAQEMREKEIKFSDVAIEELKRMYANIQRMFELAIQTFDTTMPINLHELSMLEITTDQMKDELTISHFERIAKENCTMEIGAYFTSVIADMERIADHLINIGYSIQNPIGNQLPRHDI